MVKIIGGDRLGPYLQGMAERLSKAKTVDVGFLEGATYPAKAKKALRAEYKARKRQRIKGAVEGASSDTPSVATVAAIQEFGAPSKGIPPRPFFRNMIAAKSGEWGPASAKLLKANNYDTAKTLDQVGAVIAGQLRQSIISFDGAPLAASTVKAKGFSKQLIDTGHMSNSVDHRVNSGDE